MFRTTVAVSILLVSLAIICWGFYSFLEDKKPNEDIFSPVSNDAVAVLHLSKADNFHQEIAYNSLIWKELLNYSNFHKLNNELLFFDSTAHNNPFLEKELLNREALVSFYPKENILKWLIHFPIKCSAKDFQEQLSNSGIRVKTQPFEEMDFYEIEGRNLFFLFRDQFLFVGSDPSLIKETVNAWKNGKSIDLKSLRYLASKESPANFYCKNLLISHAAQQMMKNEASSFLRNKLANWTVLDLSNKMDEMSLSGFSQTDSISFLERFKNQESNKWRIHQYLPEDVAAFLTFSITDDSDYFEKDPESFIDYNWLGDEMALAYWPQRNGEVEEIVLLGVADSVSFLDFAQQRLETDNLWTDNNLLNSIFRDIQAFDSPLHFIIQNGYLLLSRDNRTLLKLKSAIRKEQTLEYSSRFKKFQKSISSRSNFLYFSSLSYAAPHLKSNLEDSLAYWLDDLNPLMQSLSGIAFQANWLEDDCFIMLHAEFNPLEKSDKGALWQLAIEAPMYREVYLVKNHYTQHWEIFLQDTLNQIYLISPDGTILWKRKLEGPILSDVTQVDILKNNKLQMAFNTGNKIYLIDRKGRDVDGFPINIKSGCYSQLAIFDYENDRNYRFFIADKKGAILVFDQFGKALRGWDFKPDKNIQYTELKHLRVGKKDYVLARRGDGRMLLLNRKGQIRYKNDLIIPGNDYAEVFFGKDIKSSGMRFFNNSGKFLSKSFSGTETVHFEFPNVAHFNWFTDNLDEDAQLELIIYSENEIWLKELDGSDINHFRQTDGTLQSLKTYHFPKGQILLGLKFTDIEEVILTTLDGETVEEYATSTAIRIGDLTSSGNYSAITADSDGILFNFEVGTP